MSLARLVDSVDDTVVSLAEVVSLAVRVEPELLRRARLGLVKEADASVEADLWFSPLVDTQSASAFMFVPKVAIELRRRLARDRERLCRAWSVTSAVHADVAPAIALEEEINYILLTDGAGSTRLQDRLQEAVVALVEGGKDRAGVARWAVRALSRLPEEVARTQAGQMLTVAARSRLGRPDVLPEGVSPDAPWLAWVLPREAEQVRVGIRLFADGLEIGGPTEERGHVIPLPDTKPLMLHVGWREGTEERQREVRIRLDRQTRVRVRHVATPDATVRGIDVDRVVDDLNWSGLAEMGFRFAFIEATRSARPDDEAPFRTAWERMRELPVRGAYHVGTQGSGLEQADRFLETVAPGAGDLLALDLESGDYWITPGQVQAFAERVYERTGRWPGLAIGPRAYAVVAETDLASRGCWLWRRGAGPQPPYGWSGYAFTEVRGLPQTPSELGFAQHVFNGDMPALLALAGVGDEAAAAPTFTLRTAWGDSYTVRPREAPAAIAIRAHPGSDNALITWRPSEKIEGCLGFALYRRTADGREEVVSNRLDFPASPPSAGAEAGTSSTTAAPLQRFMWVDDGVRQGDVAQYRAVPMLGTPGELREGPPSEWSEPVTISTAKEPGLTVMFNRGVLGVASLAMRGRPGLMEMIQEGDREVVEHLGGHLSGRLRNFIDSAGRRGGPFYAALSDIDELTARMLTPLGPRAHVLLGDDGPRGRRIPVSLIDAGVEVTFVPHRAGIFHHRFAVSCDSRGRAADVWVGGAQWTAVGLYTQANGATIVANPEVAALFLARWQALRAGERRPSDAPPPAVKVGAARVTPWFTPVRGGMDLTDVEQRLERARQGILFAMPFAGTRSLFIPEALAQRSKVYVKGVVGQRDRGIALIDGGRTDVLSAKALAEASSALPRWLRARVEVGARIVVIDPFSDRSTVLMGSHGLSPTASAKNDETLLVVENAPAFAAAHAVRVMELFQHYKARGAARHPSDRPAALRADDGWQDRLLAEDAQAELSFWLGTSGVGERP